MSLVGVIRDAITGIALKISPQGAMLVNRFYLEVAKGNIPGYSIVHKFGAGTIGTTLTPISSLDTYNTPTSATALEVVSDNAADGVGGAGALEVTITGLDANWNEVTQVITMNGTTAVALTTNLTRLFRWYVSSSGTYANAASYSHVGSLSLQVSGGGAVWDIIGVSPIPSGQSQIGAYTVPINKKGYLLGKLVYTDTSKVADVFFFQRSNADDVVAPYSGTMRLVEREIGVKGGFDHHFTAPKGQFVGPCDVGFLAKVTTGTAEMSVEFELLVVDD